MMRQLAACCVVALALTTCAGKSDAVDHQAEWRDVLQRKKAARTDTASPASRQVYADSLSAFVRRHPNHSRAREVYQHIQLQFADELVAIGRYQDAIRFYRSVLAHNPRSVEARQGLILAMDRLAITREKLLALEKGMSHRQVAQVLGKPIPGWTVATNRRGAKMEAWYYRTTTGSVAGVYFRDGKVFAAEENSDAKIGL
jgi:hypothetical protein